MPPKDISLLVFAWAQTLHMRDPTDRMGARERQSEENEKDISLQSGASPAEVERSLAMPLALPTDVV